MPFNPAVTPIDFQPDALDVRQLELLAGIPPERRALAMMETAEWVLAGIRGTLRRRHPEWTNRELNLRVLAYVTPLRGVTVEELLRR